MTAAVIYLVAGVVFGFWASSIGKKKGRSAGWCFVCGFFLGLIGLIIVLCLPKKPLKDEPLVVSSPPAAVAPSSTGSLKGSGGSSASKAGTVEFDAEGKVAEVDMPGGKWDLKQSGKNRYYTQRGRSLLYATEILMTVASVPELTYYTVETPDGSLGRDMFGFYTEARIKTSGLKLETPAPVPDRVESGSLTAFGDPMKSQTAVAQLKQVGQYASFVLLMECGHCGYKSPVETQAGDIERQCYCCGATNSSFRATINVFTGSKMIEI